jgi:hypothetical protein
MPPEFKRKYPDTRAIIDCTEISTQLPDSLVLQKMMYSSYKHKVTYKSLVGITPGGAFFFISQLYPGSTSDREIERVINKVKKFHFFDRTIPLTMHGSINQIWTVCCLLCNAQNPLISY